MDLLVSNLREVKKTNLTEGEKTSLIYHDIFDYPLTQSELLKWEASSSKSYQPPAISFKNGYYFLKGREGIVYKRLLRKRISERKTEMARKAAGLLSFIPTIKMLGVTGALAMENASSESDIDLMVITQKNTLWITRLLAYFVLRIMNYAVRQPNDRDQKDKLCLNIWLTENHLTWPKGDRNIYSSHEIVQIVPLINKNKTYEKFITKNKWTKEFWPNAVKVNYELRTKNHGGKKNSIILLVEKPCFWFQYQYMKGKITREVVSLNRAIFHPNDWGKIVLSRLNSSL